MEATDPPGAADRAATTTETKTETVTVSVVLPAYNEMDTIVDATETTVETLADFLPTGSFEVVIAEDGCTDRTPAIASRLADHDSRIRHFHGERRSGRGGALTRAFKGCEADVVAYLDTDLATGMGHVEHLIESVRTGGYDVATGSRLLPGSRAARSSDRAFASHVYNALVRTCLSSSLADHQCGFKAFDREALLAILPKIENQHWFWDTEVLVYAQRAGYRVNEFPVVWRRGEDSTVHLFRDSYEMGCDVLDLWWRLDGDGNPASTS